MVTYWTFLSHGPGTHPDPLLSRSPSLACSLLDRPSPGLLPRLPDHQQSAWTSLPLRDPDISWACLLPPISSASSWSSSSSAVRCSFCFTCSWSIFPQEKRNFAWVGHYCPFPHVLLCPEQDTLGHLQEVWEGQRNTG